MLARLAHMLLVRRSSAMLLRVATVGLAAALVGIGMASTPLGTAADDRTRDARARSQPDLPPPPDLIIVGIDAETGSVFNQWPINLATWVLALQSLETSKARAVVLDVPFEVRDLTDDANRDFRAAVQALEQAGTQVVFLTRSCERGQAGRELRGIAPESPGEKRGGTAQLLASTGASLARGIPPPGRGAVLRSVKLGATCVLAGQERPVRSLPAELGLPKGRDGRPDPLHLAWYGGPRRFEYLAFSDLGMGTFSSELRGRTIFFGRTDGVSRDDVRTAIDGSMPHVAVEATALANARDGASMHELSSAAALLAAALLALLTWTLLVLVPVPVGAPLALAALAGWGWYAWQAFEGGLIVPLVLPLTAAGFVFVAVASMLAYLGIRERLRVQGLFARYVPADVVRDLLDNSESIDLGGESREITVLFSDIRGFTSLSEHEDPVEMVGQLNEYFSEMVDVVAEHRGTLDKFLGDGLMAIFGAPVAYDDHAARACHAALAMLDRLDVVNEGRVGRGLAPLGIGIGIHTGEAVVGNVGSPLFRVDFTAIGDTVNLAARLEAATKDVGATIVVSGETARHATEQPSAAATRQLAFVQKGAIVVKGRTQSTDAWELTEAREPAGVGGGNSSPPGGAPAPAADD